MLNFIICDDNELIRKKITQIISKLMMPLELEYRTCEFCSYNKNFEAIVNKRIGEKIYILDIEVDNKSGLDIARKIRKVDWQSVIIIITAHYELIYEAFKNRLMLLDFISKFDDYENKLFEALNIGIEIINTKPTFSFVFNHVLYKVNYADILYFTKSDSDRKVKIKTFYSEYVTTMSLNAINSKLPDYFFKTHRACIVNKNNIKEIDYKDNIITFKNGEKINLLSKNYKKEVKKHVFS